MTDANLPTSDRQFDVASAASSYQSLAALRDAHLALRRLDVQSSESGANSDRAEQIRTFLSAARKTGAFLSDPRERRAAQGILDYWSAELVTLPEVKPNDFTPSMLEPFEQRQTHTEGEQQVATDKADQRALIRWSAFARQWNTSGKDPGYLLTGDAIRQAAQFRELDPGIDDLVNASEKVQEKRARRTHNLMIAGASIFATLVVVIIFLSWQLWYLKNTSASYIQGLQRGTEKTDALDALKWLDHHQIFLAPYDLSGIRQTLEVTLPGLRLYSPNFADDSFKNVSFPKAQLAGASFTQSKFLPPDNSQWNDLSDADLSGAQFRSAQIASTKFIGANLYRAVFDRAALCNVNFSGASLRSASFWAVTLDDKTKNTLKSTAWWQAVGWPWKKIEDFAKAKASDEDIARLKGSPGFTGDLKRGQDALHIASPGKVGQALALNDIAWTRAVWGIDISKVENSQAAPASQSPPPCVVEDDPKFAHDAAEQAVCTIKKLNEGARAYSDLLASFQDTLAYTLMQSGQMQLALDQYEEIKTNNPSFFELGEVLFRYAIAQYYAERGDRVAAAKDFNAAIGDKRYQPTHEFHTLKDYIFNDKDHIFVEEFTNLLEKAMEKSWPEVPNACPPATSAAAQ